MIDSIDDVLHVNCETFLRVEKALGPLVQYVQLADTDGKEVASGIKIHNDFMPDFIILPRGVANSPLDRLVALLSPVPS